MSDFLLIIFGLLIGLAIALFYKNVSQRELKKRQTYLSHKSQAKNKSSTKPPTPKKSEKVILENLDFTGDFKKAFDLLESDTPYIFITGKAGTGKSTLLRYFRENTNKQVVVLAYTGVAAMNIQGVTIHSFFGFPPRPITRKDIKEQPEMEIYKMLDTIIIDEISMVRADFLDGIDLFMRKNGRDASKPFGGAQIVFFGDLYQLPPIVDKDEQPYFTKYYPSPWFFSSKVFQRIDLVNFELTKVYRQRDVEFIELLDMVRTKTITPRQLELLNQRFSPSFDPKNDNSWITLTATNKVASSINLKNLKLISSPLYTYIGIIDGDFPEGKKLPTDTILKFKKDAQVMFVKNDINGRWVNGTIGKIYELNQDKILVEIQDGGKAFVYPVVPVTWEVLKYRIDYGTGSIATDVIASFTQYPLKLAWAITVHKSQGLTFEKTVIDLGNGAFAHGQTYVALSRNTSYNGIVLKKQIQNRDIILDYHVQEYVKNSQALMH